MTIESSDPEVNQRQRVAWWLPQLAGPVIAAALVRFALLALAVARSGTSALVPNDTMGYLVPGRNLLLHGRFYADGVPDLLRTPGYPLFLAITNLGGVPASATANVILSVFCVVLVWRLGQKVFQDDRIALYGAWIFAFEPLSALFSVSLYSETLFLALFLLSMERIAAFLLERRLRVLAVGGLWLAAATFVRPVSYYLPVALALGLFIVLMRVPGLRWKAPAVLLISVLPWLAAWQIRNHVETGYGGFTSITDENSYFYLDADVTARVEHRSTHDVQKELGIVFTHDNSHQWYLYQPYLDRHPEQAGWSQSQRLSYMHSEANRVIRAHYGVYLRSCFAALAHILLDSGDSYFSTLIHREGSGYHTEILSGAGWARRKITLAKMYPLIAVEKAGLDVVMIGLYLLAMRGIVLARRGAFPGDVCNSCLWMLLGTSLYFLAISAVGSGGVSRYRLPVLPVVCILASAGLPRKGSRTQSCVEI
jgi:hypothetical protein